MTYFSLQGELFFENLLKPNCTTFTLTKIKKNTVLPPFELPTWDYRYPCEPKDEACGPDGTFHVTLDRIISGLSSSLAIIPLMAYLESISIAKGFGLKNDYRNGLKLLLMSNSNFLTSVFSYHSKGIEQSRIDCYWFLKFLWVLCFGLSSNWQFFTVVR